MQRERLVLGKADRSSRVSEESGVCWPPPFPPLRLRDLQEGLGEGGGSVCRLPFVVDLVLTSLVGVGQSSTAPVDLRL